MGGDCLNTGCVPSKALIRTARLAHEIRTGEAYGLKAREPEFRLREWSSVSTPSSGTSSPPTSVRTLHRLGVDVRLGHAKIVDPWTVEI
jgi:pyruvate/2-oxoglutarate dehydrogenase complex dihydrolipoamide dehydrogenase (E3) component